MNKKYYYLEYGDGLSGVTLSVDFDIFTENIAKEILSDWYAEGMKVDVLEFALKKIGLIIIATGYSGKSVIEILDEENRSNLIDGTFGVILLDFSPIEFEKDEMRITGVNEVSIPPF